jgi:hypothetical protein
MSDTTDAALIEAVRAAMHDAEFDAVAAKGRFEAYRHTLELLERGPRRRPGRPRNASLLNPFASQAPNIVPQRVEGSLHEPEDAA